MPTLADLQNDILAKVGTVASGWDTSDITAAIWEGCLAYSSYQPMKKRIDQSNTVQNYSSGVSSLEVVGGWYLPGDNLIVDFGFTAQPLTVLSFTPTINTDDPTLGVGAPTATLTFTSPLTANIAAGALITTNLPQMSRQPGVQFLADTNMVVVPLDFLKVELDSFSLAVGARLQYKVTSGFYDSTYINNELMSGQTIGSSITYAASAVWPGYPISGNPFANYNAPGGAQNALFSTLWTFYTDTSRPYLGTNITQGQTRIFQFDYYGVHCPVLLNSRAIPAVTSYAAYFLLQQLASYQSSQIKNSLPGQSNEDPTANAKVSQAAADRFLQQFELRTRLKPYASSG